MKELERKNYNDLMELIQKENNINDFFKNYSNRGNLWKIIKNVIIIL